MDFILGGILVNSASTMSSAQMTQCPPQTVWCGEAWHGFQALASRPLFETQPEAAVAPCSLEPGDEGVTGGLRRKLPVLLARSFAAGMDVSDGTDAVVLVRVLHPETQRGREAPLDAGKGAYVGSCGA